MIFLRAWYRDFLGDLQQLLQSGIPVIEALALLEKERTGERAAFASHLRERVQAGSTLGVAWAAWPRAKEAHAAVIEAGEKSGRLPAALGMILRQLERQKELLDQTRAQLGYYLLCLIFAVVALPLPLLFTGHRLKYLAIQVAFFGSIASVVWLVRRGVRLPWASRVAFELEAGRAFQMLGLFVSSGISIGNGLPATARTVRRPELAQALRDAEARLRAGESLRGALGASPALRGRETWLARIAVAEHAGAFDRVLGDLGETIERDAWARVVKAVKWLPFVILPLVGAMVLYQALNVLGKWYGGL